MIAIAVVQQKGGSGKTTLTINLAAAALLESEETVPRVLIVDMDRQESVSDWSLSVPSTSPLAAITVKTHAKPLDVPRFEALTSGFDVVFFDCPGRGDDLAETAAALCDLVLIPVQPGPLDFWATDRTLEGIDRGDDWRALDGRASVVRCFVLNRAVRGTKLAEEAERELRASGRGKFLGTVYQRAAFPTALARGESVFTSGAVAELAALDVAKLWRAMKGVVRVSQSQKSTRRRSKAKGRKGRK